MTLILDAADVEALVDMPTLIDAVEQGCRERAAGTAAVPPRLNLQSRVGFFRIMPAVLPGSGVMGAKIFQGSGRNGVRYLVLLYDEGTGELLALVDASYLTAARTGAATAVAVSHLARADAGTIAVIGSGLEARTNLAAVHAARSVSQVRVFSPREHRRKQFATDMSAALHVQVVPAAAPEDAVRGADIVLVATNTGNAPDPIAFRGAWMEPGMHVSAIGSTMPSLREADPETFARASLIVFDQPEQVRHESGDVVAAIEAGCFDESRVRSLPDLVTQAERDRPDPEAITLFKSVGTADQDVMAAHAVYRRACEVGRGRDVGDIVRLKPF